MKRIFCGLLAWTVLLAAASPAFAYRYWGAKPLAMGGAYSAVADDLNSIQWNPAGLAVLSQRRQIGFIFNYERHEHLLRDYQFLHPEEFAEAAAEDDFGGEVFFEDEPDVDLDKKMARDWYHVALADGYTNPFVSVGLAFTGLNFPNRTFKDSSDYSTDLAIASSLADIVKLGTTFRYIDVDPNGGGEFDMDLGVQVDAVGIIGIGLVGRNLFGNDEPMIVRREVALGLAGFAMDYAVISAEVSKVFDVTDVNGTFNFGAGVEGILAKVVSLRGGYHWDQVSNARMYSVGAAYVDNMGTLAYSFQGDVDQVRNYVHSIQISLFFP